MGETGHNCRQCGEDCDCAEFDPLMATGCTKCNECASDTVDDPHPGDCDCGDCNWWQDDNDELEYLD